MYIVITRYTLKAPGQMRQDFVRGNFKVVYLMCKLLTIGPYLPFFSILGGGGGLCKPESNIVRVGVIFVSKNLKKGGILCYNKPMQTKNDCIGK